MRWLLQIPKANAEFTLHYFHSCRITVVFTLHDCLAGVVFSCCCVHIARWIGDRRLHTMHDFTIEESPTTLSGPQTTFHITPPRTSRCPVSCSLIGCRSSPMYFQSELISHSRILNRRHVQIFFLYSILLDCAFDNSHCVIVTRVNKHQFSISQNLSCEWK